MKKLPATRHNGTVVGVTANKLTTTCSEGKEHRHTVTTDTKVTHDGKASKLADLTAGTEVRVTTHADDKTLATAVRSGKVTPASARPM